MKSSFMPIPLTQRDSRPHSQAEQDQEESFNARRRLKIPNHQASDLGRRLEHYQNLITRMLEDADFREKLNCETVESSLREQDKRSKITRARAKKKGPKKSRTSSRPDKKPPGYFAHLDKVITSREPAKSPDWSEWHARRSEWYEKPAPEPPPESFPFKNSAFYQAEYDRHMADLMKEYHIDTPKLAFIWKPKLTQLALKRMHPQVEHYLKQLAL